MILHLIDDEKVMDFVIEEFEEAAPESNRWVILDEFNREKLNFIRQSESVELIALDSSEFHQLVSHLKDFKAIIIHYLSPSKLELIKQAKEHGPFVWIFWGQDAQKSFTDRAYLFHTGKLLFRQGNYQELLWPVTNRLRRFIFPFSERWNLFSKIEYCATNIKEELDLMSRKLQLKFKHIDFTYGYAQKLVSESPTLTGNNILIGNSSTFSCNHLDAFKIVSKCALNNRKVIVPLNYGNRKYGEDVIENGNKLFGERFIPITDYLENSEYVRLINSCSIMIMAHLRHQAFGNIQIGLLNGTKIFMHPKNVLYQNLISLGFIIFKLNEFEEQFDTPFSNEQIVKNKTLMRKHYGMEKGKERTRNLTQMFLSN